VFLYMSPGQSTCTLYLNLYSGSSYPSSLKGPEEGSSCPRPGSPGFALCCQTLLLGEGTICGAGQCPWSQQFL
jgi:hypothetical protein